MAAGPCIINKKCTFIRSRKPGAPKGFGLARHKKKMPRDFVRLSSHSLSLDDWQRTGLTSGLSTFLV